eukprot:TRINITY_DN65686_c8_g7_i1.p1 TRINITY_DN65686_c8_g7~~TRINITY_DN65686_c8_g7_i1.p1  ORF type:complete len:972 (+),score=98.80 TRINITY_DN65686_c8_g7_i1:65-2980(+)
MEPPSALTTTTKTRRMAHHQSSKRRPHTAAVLREKCQKYRGDKDQNGTPHVIHPNIYAGCATEGGFGRFHSSLHSILHRMGSSFTLEQKWEKVSDYLDNFFWDEQCATAERIARSLFEATQKRTNHLMQPCEPRVAVCCMLLDQFLLYFGKVRPTIGKLCTAVRDEIFRGIFVHAPEPVTKPFHEHEGDATTLEVMSARFMQETWFGWKAAHDSQLGDVGRLKEKAQGEAAYWKDLYLRKVFVGWRLHVNQAKERKRELAKMRTELQLEATRVQSITAQMEAAKEKLLEMEHIRRQLKESNEKVMQLQMQNKELEDLKKLTDVIDEKESEMAIQRELMTQMEGKVKTAEGRMAFMREDYESLQETMWKWYNQLRGPEHERDLRDKAADVLQSALALNKASASSKTSGIGQANADTVLLEWVNKMLDLHPDGQEYKLHGLSGGGDICNAYLCLMHVLSPGTFSRAKCAEALRSDDLVYKAQIIRSLFNTMGVPYLTTDAEMTQAGHTNQHRLALAVLFQRWADGTAVTLTGDRPLGATEGTVYPEYFSAKQWNQELEQWHTTTRKWKSLGQQIVRQCEQATLDEVRGEQQREEEPPQDKDFVKYTKVIAGRLGDLLPKDLEARGDLISKLTGVLTSNFTMLRNVYRYYASSDPSVDQVMSVQEFWRFCTDAKIANRQIDRTVVKTIFAEVNKTDEEVEHEEEVMRRQASMRGQDAFRRLSLYSGVTAGVLGVEKDKEKEKEKEKEKDKKRKNSNHNPVSGAVMAGGQKVATEAAAMKVEMTPEEWVESLIRLAHRKYRKNNESLPSALGSLLDNHVSKHCLQVDLTDFKAQVYSKEVQEVLAKYRHHLSDVFKHWARVVTPGHPYEMSTAQWKKLLDDATLVDEVFTHYAAQAIFTKLQEDDSIDLLYHEFTEAIVAVSAFKNPAPYLPLHQRLDHFIHSMLLPRVCHKFHWKDYKPTNHDGGLAPVKKIML